MKNVEIKIPRQLYDLSLKDLQRPHAHAYERIGFIFFRQSHNQTLLLATDYEPVKDEDYIPNETVGAHFNRNAIRNVMQRILDTGESAFHVHLHEFPGGTEFSRTDLKSLNELIPSFVELDSNMHGAILYNENKINSLVWQPAADQAQPASRISIVGFPTETKWGLK